MHAAIAPASVASICAVEEALCAGARSPAGAGAAGASLNAGAITRIGRDAGGSIPSVCCATVVAPLGGLSAAGLALPCSSVAAMPTGGAGLAAEATGEGMLARGAAAGADPARRGEAGTDVAGAGAVVDVASSVANCSTVSEAADSSAAFGATLGQAIRELIFSARRAGR